MNIKNTFKEKNCGLRVIPLSKKIKKELLMEPSTSSSEEKGTSTLGSDTFRESIVDLIRFEVKRCIGELKLSEIFVRKTELPQYLGKKHKDDFDDNSSVNYDGLGQNEKEAIQELENALLSEQDYDETSTPDTQVKNDINTIFSRNKSPKMNQVEKYKNECQTNGDGNNIESSVHIMFTMAKNNGNNSENSRSDQEFEKNEQLSNTNSPVIKKMDSRIKMLEKKIASVYRALQKIQMHLKRGSRHRKMKGIKRSAETITRSDLTYIETKVEESLYEKDTPSKVSTNDKIDPYDELFYESREYKMNQLHYKKSLRTLYLNQRPRLQMSLKPPIVYKFDTSSKTKPRLGFINTPSRLRVK